MNQHKAWPHGGGQREARYDAWGGASGRAVDPRLEELAHYEAVLYEVGARVQSARSTIGRLRQQLYDEAFRGVVSRRLKRLVVSSMAPWTFSDDRGTEGSVRDGSVSGASWNALDGAGGYARPSCTGDGEARLRQIMDRLAALWVAMEAVGLLRTLGNVCGMGPKYAAYWSRRYRQLECEDFDLRLELAYLLPEMRRVG